MGRIQKRGQKKDLMKEQKLKILSICSKMIDEVSELLCNNSSYVVTLENLRERGIIDHSSSIIDVLSKLTTICHRIPQGNEMEDSKFDPGELPIDILRNIIEICQQAILSRDQDLSKDI